VSGGGETDPVDRVRAASCAAAGGAPPSGPSPADSRILLSEEIFRGSRAVVIVHRGMLYRLLETRQGKLILNK